MNLFKTLKLDTVDRITTVTLNRPQTMNAVSPLLMDELGAACEQLAQDSGTRAVIITATGRAFSSGLDLNVFGQIGKTIQPQDLPALIDHWQAVFNALENLPQVTIAAINGTTLGIGIELILCTDFRVASTRALFGMPELRLGIIPDVGGIPRLVRTVGAAWAKEIILRPRNISAMEAVRIGLVNRVSEHGDLIGLARKWATQFAALPAPAVRQAKRLLNSSFDIDLATSLRQAKEAQLQLFSTPEFWAAVQAMREQRPAEENLPEETPMQEQP
ncbi:MAG: enoyl-CoA hydratase/isomerase family protein [Anaerolineae bacterium]